MMKAPLRARVLSFKCGSLWMDGVLPDAFKIIQQRSFGSNIHKNNACCNAANGNNAKSKELFILNLHEDTAFKKEVTLL